jgi:hypothetical protein
MTQQAIAAIREAAERIAANGREEWMGDKALLLISSRQKAQEILRLLDEAEKPCNICRTAGDFIGESDYGDTRLFYRVSGAYMQVFDEEYPGFVDNIPIRFCPGCGRRIDRGE